MVRERRLVACLPVDLGRSGGVRHAYGADGARCLLVGRPRHTPACLVGVAGSRLSSSGWLGSCVCGGCAWDGVPLRGISACAAHRFDGRLPCALAARSLVRRGLAAAVGLLAYPIGLVAAPAGAVWLLAHRSVPRLERVRRVTLMAYPSLIALWLFVFDQWLETGHWNAYLLVQRKYDHHLQDPFHMVVRAGHRVFDHGPLFTMTKSLALQTLLVSFVLFCVLIELVVRRGPFAHADALVAIWAVMAWAMPISETNVATYRGEAALLPLALLVRRLPRPSAPRSRSPRRSSTVDDQALPAQLPRLMPRLSLDLPVLGCPSLRVSARHWRSRPTRRLSSVRRPQRPRRFG